MLKSREIGCVKRFFWGLGCYILECNSLRILRVVCKRHRKPAKHRIHRETPLRSTPVPSPPELHSIDTMLLWASLYRTEGSMEPTLPAWEGIKGSKLYGGFLKWWYPATMGFPTKNDHFGVFGGYHYFRKHPYVPGCWGKSLVTAHSWLFSTTCVEIACVHIISL